MTYLDEIATEIEQHVASELRPDGDLDVLFRIYAVLALAKGRDVDAADVHHAWAAWMAGRDPQHPALKPFEDLDPETQAADQPYVDAIHQAVAALGL